MFVYNHFFKAVPTYGALNRTIHYHKKKDLYQKIIELPDLSSLNLIDKIQQTEGKGCSNSDIILKSLNALKHGKKIKGRGIVNV